MERVLASQLASLIVDRYGYMNSNKATIALHRLHECIMCAYVSMMYVWKEW